MGIYGSFHLNGVGHPHHFSWEKMTVNHPLKWGYHPVTMTSWKASYLLNFGDPNRRIPDHGRFFCAYIHMT